MVAGESVLGTSIWSKEFRSRSGGEAASTLELCNGGWHWELAQSTELRSEAY